MLVIRMRRMGAKKRPFLRIVVTDSRAPRDSRAVEILGHYDPRTRPETIRIDHARLGHWVGKGAQPSDTVRTLVARHPEGEEPVAAEVPAPVLAAAAAESAPPASVAAEAPEASEPEASPEAPAE